MLTDHTPSLPDLYHKSDEKKRLESFSADSSKESDEVYSNTETSLSDQCITDISAAASSQKRTPQPRQGIEFAYQEWIESCVADKITQTNVEWLEGDEAVEVVTGPALGKMSGHGLQYATIRVTQLLERYDHLREGGWWVSGLDPLNNWEKMEWGQFKPIAPRRSYDNPEKIIKYETQPKTPTRAIFLDGAVDWPAVQENTAIPLLITEGAKKAGAALTLGYAAIALPGVNSGYRTKDTLQNPVEPYLIPDIAAMVIPGRQVYLAFDQDEKPETVYRVELALSRFGQLLKAAGCDVRVVRWATGKGKGIDDLIAAQGPEAFHQAVSSAFTLEEWQIWRTLENRLTIAPTIRLKANDLKVLSPESIPDAGIIAIASAKGTGKTNLIGGLIADQDRALLAGHRISLMRNLSERCGVRYRGDLDKHNGRFIAGDAYTLRVGTCVDSLLAINPEAFRGCDLVLDEVCQVLRHLLASSTCNKDGKRPVLLMRFRELVQAAQRVIVADADLDNKAIDYLQQLRGDTARPFLICNDYKAPGYAVRFIESPDATAVISELLKEVRAGKRIYVATDSKRGSKRVDKLIKDIGGIHSLLINSETSGSGVAQAFMEAPDNFLKSNLIQVVIASPSAGTGISIEEDHFDKIYGIFWGASCTDADMSQALSRVRQASPRVVWCAKYGQNFSKVGRETSPLKLKDLLKQKADANTLLIRASLSDLGYSGISKYDWANDPHIGYWAETEAQLNRSMWNLRTSLKVRLMHEGNQVESVELLDDKPTRLLIQSAREELKIERAIAIESATNLTPAEAKQLDQLDGLDESQRLALQKWHIAEFYCVPVAEVSSDLVIYDNDGRRRGQMLNLENFLHPDVAIAADVRSLEKQIKWQSGLTPWDIGNASLKRWCRQQLGLDTYLAPDRYWNSESLKEFKQTALKFRLQIKAALNFTVTDEMASVQILNQLLEQMGVDCTAQQTRKAGERIRTYSLDLNCWQQNSEILERRKVRRNQLKDVTPPLFSNQTKGGCDTDTSEPEKLEQWRWGTSLSPWVIERIEGEQALIRGVSNVPFRVAVAELSHWEDSA
jgi:hypothetical protein